MATRIKLLAETSAPVDEIAQILRAEHGDPFHILGMHLVEVEGKAAVAIRAFLPRAHDAWVVRDPGEGGAVPRASRPCSSMAGTAMARLGLRLRRAALLAQVS